MKYENLIVNSC